MQRYGQVIKVKPDQIENYKYHHKNSWPEINAMIKECNIQNYSIYLKDDFLFSYFEYVGSDYDSDMAKMAADKKTQEWWDLVKPYQTPLETKQPGEWWADMEEVYHLD
ncbi:L-rhamnose 1-epimerase [Candidatus Epulonipiscioides saccharophilum]|nr:L-rhamnose 1-epimerase [Epulopiscium sp. SCG-B10WGA-EpuloB]